MLALPDSTRDGYRLAKMMRNTHIMAPIADKLKKLGAVLDLEDLITSYMLKNCLMSMTQNLEQSNTDIASCDYVTWAIRIYEELKRYITKNKEIPNFLYSQANQTAVKRTLFRCHRRRFDTRLLCCRKRGAMLLVARRIISVLKTIPRESTATSSGESRSTAIQVQQSDRPQQDSNSPTIANTSTNTRNRNQSACDDTLITVDPGAPVLANSGTTLPDDDTQPLLLQNEPHGGGAVSAYTLR